jgi:hypothetical protein
MDAFCWHEEKIAGEIAVYLAVWIVGDINIVAVRQRYSLHQQRIARKLA